VSYVAQIRDRVLVAASCKFDNDDEARSFDSLTAQELNCGECESSNVPLKLK
jgi:hypothetical protein